MTKLFDDVYKFWNNSTPDILDKSHILGEGRWKDANLWERCGAYHSYLYQMLCFQTDRDLKVKKMVEWGTGGGINVCGLYNFADKYVGIDISKNSLANAQKAVNKYYADSKKFFPMDIDLKDPTLLIPAIGKDVDFVISTSVFQHMPTKEYAERVMKTFHDILVPKGIAMVQVRYDKKKPLTKKDKNFNKEADYIKDHINFLSYTITEFNAIITRNKFDIMSYFYVSSNRYLYYLLRKK